MRDKELSAWVPLALFIVFLIAANVAGLNTIWGELFDTGALIFIIITVITLFNNRSKNRPIDTEPKV